MIGVCWEAGGWDADRSVPPALLAPLMRARPCLSLQPRPAGGAALNPQGCPADVAATAAWIAGLDLVVTVDTMVAHLAGALGTPVRLMLKHDADWRWGDGETSCWYPSVRIRRQTRPGAWGPVAAGIVRDLTAPD